MSSDQAPPFVIYRPDDYARLGRRLVCIVVDLIGVLVLLAGIVLAADLVGWVPLEAEHLPPGLGASLLGAGVLYFTALKRSRLRTPGYWATGLRIVDLRGKPPSMFVMTLRLFLWILGPVHPLLDVFFMSNNESRQTVRDRLLGTYVIRRGAQPAAHGVRTYERWGFMGMWFLFPVVAVPIEEREAGIRGTQR